MPVVMLVDDEPRILSALARALRKEDFEVVLRENARDALAELEARQIDLVVSDHKMPGLSGIELLERVAKSWPSTARILLSGWLQEVEPTALDATRPNAVVQKPWEDRDLKQVIRSALARGGVN